jgi:hypothetical protein
MGRLIISDNQQHRKYTNKRTCLSYPKIIGPKSSADKLMDELTEIIEKRIIQSSRYNSWISEETWKLIVLKVIARRNNNTEMTKQLKK